MMKRTFIGVSDMGEFGMLDLGASTLGSRMLPDRAASKRRYKLSKIGEAKTFGFGDTAGMERLQTAINYIESQLCEPLTLTQIADKAHLSPYYFSRLFRSRTGQSPMDYVRIRRLSEAVRKIRRDPQLSIRDVALSSGFDTHQGFSTAFKKTFAVAPAAYRLQPFPLPIQEKIVMSASNAPVPQGPEYKKRASFTVAGLSVDCTQQDKLMIPELWDRFSPLLGSISGQIGHTTYGICIPTDECDLRYMAAVEIDPAAATSTQEHGLTTFHVPAARYAVFSQDGSVDLIQPAFGYIFGQWLPQSDHESTGSADFEQYDERFNPATNDGVVEIWIPIR